MRLFLRAILFVTLASLAVSAAFSLVRMLEILGSDGWTAENFIAALSATPILIGLGVLCAMGPALLSTFLLVAVRGVSRAKFLGLSLTFASLTSAVTFYLLFGHGSILISMVAGAISIATFSWLSLRLLFADRHMKFR